jgi:hypothetical protein
MVVPQRAKLARQPNSSRSNREMRTLPVRRGTCQRYRPPQHVGLGQLWQILEEFVYLWKQAKLAES